MAAFLNVCRFISTAGGTTDWTYSSAVTGYQSPTLANTINGRLYKFRAESADLSQWELCEGAYDNGTGVFARTTVLYNSAGTGTAPGQSGAGTKISFSSAPQVAIIALKEDLLSIEEANAFTVAQRKQARANISALLRGCKPFGLTLSAAGGTGTFGIAAGEAADSTGSDLMALASAFTKTTGAWAVGSGNGGVISGSLSGSSWYNVFLIKRPDTGVVDVVADLTTNGATNVATLAGGAYTLFRRIGSMLTDSSNFWVKFFQIGSVFMWDASVQNVNAGTIGATAISQALTTPPGLMVEANIHVAISVASTGCGLLVSSFDISDQVAGGGLPNVGFIQVAGGVSLTGLREYTNLSSSVRMRATVAATTYYVWTIGWDDLGLQQGI